MTMVLVCMFIDIICLKKNCLTFLKYHINAFFFTSQNKNNIFKFKWHVKTILVKIFSFNDFLIKTKIILGYTNGSNNNYSPQ